MTKKKILFLTIFLSLALVLPLAVKASHKPSQQQIYIPADENREGNVYLVGQSIIVDGNINGDLIAIGQSLKVNGQINGDLIAAVQSIDVNGKIEGNIRALGENINLNGTTERNITLLAANVNFNETASTGWDFLFLASNINIKGAVAGELRGVAEMININGKIGKDVNITLNDRTNGTLNIYSDAVINGNLNYTAKNDANITNKEAVSGTITKSIPKKSQSQETANWLWRRLYSLFSALIIGLLIVSIFRKKINSLDNQLLEKIKKSAGPGLLILLVTPLASLFIAATFIGLPLALIIFFLWLASLYLAKILVAVVFGLWLSKKFFEKYKDNVIFVMTIGVTATWIAFSLPYIGNLLAILATILGLGFIYILKKQNN